MILPESWKNYIKKSLILAERLCMFNGTITSNLIKDFQNPQDTYSYFAPDLFIWDPVGASESINRIVCPTHLTSLEVTNVWLDGKDNSRLPRKLYDITGPMLLIGWIYKCTLFSHNVRSTENSLLLETPRFSSDVLFGHKFAVRQQFLISLYQNVCKGLTFTKIHDIIKERTLPHTY